MGARLLKIFFLAVAFSFSGVALGLEYYIDNNGGDDVLTEPNGSFLNPFQSFTDAFNAVNDGDTIWVRGGTYNFSSMIQVNQDNGSPGNEIKMWAYQNETPILDFATQALGSANFGLRVDSDYWHVKGLTIQNAGDNGLHVRSSFGLFEQITTRFNRDSGIQLHDNADHNLVLNSDSYGNYDPDNRGEDADGFAIKDNGIGIGNIFRGVRAWDNSDDGVDFFGAGNGALIQDSWFFENGLDPGGAGTFQGDGNGIKLGHDSGPHILNNVVVVNNPVHGIDVNGNGYNYSGNTPTTPNGSHVEVYNSTSFRNGQKNWVFDENIAHILQNNVSLSGGSSDTFVAETVHDHNTWNGGAFTVNAADFLSLDFDDGGEQEVAQILRQARQADGSLPDIGDFLKLDPESNLVDVGVPISFTFAGVTYNLPYNGDATDLGAFEVVEAEPILIGDYNGDGKVSTADFTVWRDRLGAATLTNRDPDNSGPVGTDDFDSWKERYGESNLGSGGAFAAIPEPATILALSALAVISAFVRQRRFGRD